MNRRLPGWLALGALLAVVSPGPARSQESLPESIVLVLNVLSETHARPTTGVVISPAGQLLVPAAFVGRGDQIVILANGNSLETNAVETRTEARSSETGLAVLGAADLNRAPISIRASNPVNGERLAFFAFPPAERLAEGAPPLRETVSTVIEDRTAALSPDTPLPDVTGALIDRCGHLAGLVLVSDETEASRGPRILWPEDLRASLQAFGVQADFRNCGSDAAPDAATADPMPSPGSGSPQILDNKSLQPKDPDLDVSSARANLAGSDAADDQALGSADAREAEVGADDSPVEEAADARNEVADRLRAGPATRSALEPKRGLSPLLWSLLAALFGMAALGGWWLGRNSRRALPPQPLNAPERSTAPATGPSNDVQTSEFSLLDFAATLPDGTAQKLSCRLHREHGSILMGRGQVDLVIRDASLSPVHGRIQVADRTLWYSDAGSSQGSWVNGISCLEGERFEVREGSSLILGVVHLVLTSVRADEHADP